MNKTQTKLDAERYVAPRMKTKELTICKCIAASGDVTYQPGGSIDGFDDGGTY